MSESLSGTTTSIKQSEIQSTGAPMDADPKTSFHNKHPCRAWLMRTSTGLAIVGLYVASIGPLAGLEAHGYGNPRIWRGLKPVFFPVFWTWKHGPDWWAEALKQYAHSFITVSHFEVPEKPYFAPFNNNAQNYRSARKWCEDAGPEHVELGKYYMRQAIEAE